LIRDPDRSVGHKNDPFGEDFLDQIMSVDKKTRESNLKKIEKAMTIAVPYLTRITIQADEKGKTHLKGNYEHWSCKDEWQTEKQFSEGTLRLMGLLWSLLNGSEPLLLEEPELSLLPEVIRHIPRDE
jgi:predicted ATPase